jgi:virginiamycin B lyase
MTFQQRHILAAVSVVLIAPVAAHAQRGRGQVQLPDGPGKPVVEANCTACHGLFLIPGAAGYDQRGWHDLIGTMVALPDAEMTQAAQYLAAHFPERPGRRPTLVPGEVEITIKEWVVPTLGQRPRDPLQLADGTIWWTGMYADLLGRLNPATEDMKEYPLPEGARAHGIAADEDGNIWYTGNGNGTVGRLNPATGDITEYKMPLPNARDPHTPIFDREGTLWFTLQNSNMVGRLVPATGEITLKEVPTPRGRPYGIKIAADGTPWFAYNGSNRLGSIDPQTMDIREHPLPTPETTIRRLDFASDGTIWYVDSSRGYLGHFDPKTGERREWPSPSGPQSHPYAIAVIDDKVWYNESAMRPDALVRFDPETETFQSWAIPSGVGIIRHMRATPDGNLVIHQSSTNRVGLVIIGAEGR